VNIPITNITHLVDVAKTYLKAQGVEEPSEDQLAAAIHTIRTLNPMQLKGDYTRPGHHIIRIPDGTLAERISDSSNELAVMGLASQYTLGKIIRVTVKNSVVTVHYDLGCIMLFHSTVMEIDVLWGATHCIPGDIVDMARSHGKFRGIHHPFTHANVDVYSYQHGHIDIKDPDVVRPNVPAYREVAILLNDKMTVEKQLVQ